MKFTKTQIAYGLLIVCAFARLLLQLAALPPYAGLDEIYHVARLAFVRAEHRNPMTTEKSIPPYLMKSIAAAQAPSGAMSASEMAALRSVAMPAMGETADRWPDIVSQRAGRIVVDLPLTAGDLKPYIVPNYEAQQPSLYYTLAARIVPVRSALFELRAWRALSLLFALIVVLATAEIGRRWLGPIGMLGGAVLVSLPTWETLVIRASDDAYACMLAAVAVAISVSRSRSPQAVGAESRGVKQALAIAVEALAWGLALNAKLYTWPLLIILPLLWWQQRAPKARMIAVTVVSLFAILLTFSELSSRARNPLGIVAFDRPGGAAYDATVSISEIVRVTIASFAWTSGQYNDALRPAAIALYLGPILIAIIAARRSLARQPRNLAMAALLAFAAAQGCNIIAGVLARHAGNPMPIFGKEGWYWYVLSPVIIPALLMLAVARWRIAAWWLVIWDVVITECALLQDFAGTTSPAHGSLLFRWGPLHLPFSAHLGGIGAGPLAAWTTAIRLVHLAAFFSLESLLQHVRRNDRNIDTAHPG